MIEIKRTVTIIEKNSDYCDGCPYYSPETIDTRGGIDNVPHELLISCEHGNFCDELIQRVMRNERL